MWSWRKTRLRKVLTVCVVTLALIAVCAFVLASRSGPEGKPDKANWGVAKIWGGVPSGDLPVTKSETRVLQDQKWRQITVIKNVSQPTVTIIRPPEGKSSGAAMIVLPGGAFGALAWDIEGTEVGEWLAERGITAFILKYRVRTPTARMWLGLLTGKGLGAVMEPGRAAAAADAMQAVRFVRANAALYAIDPNRVGMIGFSAGAITTFRVLFQPDPSARPNLVASIYGMMFDQGTPPQNTPLFLAVASDDPSSKGDEGIDKKWRDAGLPVELHVFKSGQHGFGLGRPGTESVAFPGLFEKWLRAQGFIAPDKLTGAEHQAATALAELHP